MLPGVVVEAGPQHLKLYVPLLPYLPDAARRIAVADLGAARAVWEPAEPAGLALEFSEVRTCSSPRARVCFHVCMFMCVRLRLCGPGPGVLGGGRRPGTQWGEWGGGRPGKTLFCLRMRRKGRRAKSEREGEREAEAHTRTTSFNTNQEKGRILCVGDR
jgi:hypothetical protein